MKRSPLEHEPDPLLWLYEAVKEKLGMPLTPEMQAAVTAAFIVMVAEKK